MPITEVIDFLKNNLDQTDITLYQGASEKLISDFELCFNIKLPNDIKEFYRFSDGFESDEDMFRIIPLNEIIDQSPNLYIGEYLVYCDIWELQINPLNNDDYLIFHEKIVLTNSFTEFIQRFLNGGVFNPGGLYKWHDEIRLK